MSLSQEKLDQLLDARPFRFYESIGSTQDVALEWLREGAPAGAAVIADEQVNGRGRRGHGWYTPLGVALAVSVILRPNSESLHQVTMLGALAIMDVLKSLGAQDIGIKWPNDVQLQEKKVCGILPEAVWEGERLLGVALGMGVNVRVDFDGTDLESSAISIEPALGIQTDRAQLLAVLLERVDDWMTHLGTPYLFQRWRQHLSMLGQPISVMAKDGMIRGVAETVDGEGALLVRNSRGEVHRIIAGDIALGGD
ncbi:MAG: biotin--[acetyl-CoA-carboxylase] ligase [bacterium]|nr:biotin--[acetyl-CoA-carboxylase] ligase [bacterium]